MIKEPIDTLTKRQKEILELVADGLTNRQIGALIFIDERTVRQHLCIIFDILNVETRTAAARCFWVKKLENAGVKV